VNETYLPDLDYEAQHQLADNSRAARVCLAVVPGATCRSGSIGGLRPDRDSRYTRYSAIVYLLPAMNAREMRHIPFMRKADDRYRTLLFRIPHSLLGRGGFSRGNHSVSRSL
jgi:hypothetical protein